MATAQDSSFPNGRETIKFVGSVARTDTTAKTLFTLPAGVIPLTVRLASTNNSDAATTATLSVGTSGGAATTYLNAVDIKTAATGKGSWVPVTSGSAKLGVANATGETVNGTYAETGGASTTGGPWIVIIECLVV